MPSSGALHCWSTALHRGKDFAVSSPSSDGIHPEGCRGLSPLTSLFAPRALPRTGVTRYRAADCSACVRTFLSRLLQSDRLYRSVADYSTVPTLFTAPAESPYPRSSLVSALLLHASQAHSALALALGRQSGRFRVRLPPRCLSRCHHPIAR